MSYKIIGDSCLDCNKELYKHVQIIPLSLEVGDYKVIDDETFNQIEFIKKVKESSESPRSACPSPVAYMKAYEGEEERVYCITLSKELSGSYNSAVVGKDMFYEDFEGSTKKIAIFNSKSAACGESLIAKKIIELEEKGLSFEEVCSQTEEFLNSMTTLFVLESLDTLKKNGRLTGISALLVTALNIKLLMGSKEGSIIKIDQARGINKALKKLIEHVINNVKNPEERTLGISYCNCPERAKSVADAILKEVKFKDVYITNSQGVTTMYANDGGIVISY